MFVIIDFLRFRRDPICKQMRPRPTTYLFSSINPNVTIQPLIKFGFIGGFPPYRRGDLWSPEYAEIVGM